MSVNAGYCEDDDAVFVACSDSQVSVSTHLNKAEVDDLIKGLKKAQKQVKVGFRKQPNN